MTNAVPEVPDFMPRASYQNVALTAGPAVFVLMLLLGAEQQLMSVEAWRTAAVGLWMAIWWATEAIPVPVTAFLPIVTFDFLGIADIKEAAAPYSNPIIYLFLGAFILALSVERWNLHKRVALLILSHTGTEGKRLILGFMLVAALLSMWMTNTSTTMMLMPIAISVVTVIVNNVDGLSTRQGKDFQIAMLLGLAFAATIGGLATLVGTPPNALLAAFLSENYGIEISFVRWMMVGVPVTIVMLPLAWVVLTRIAFKVEVPANEEVHKYLTRMKEEMGPITVPEKRVAIIFVLVVFAWILRRPIGGWLPLEGLSDTGIAMAAALALFLVPSGDRRQPLLMTWHDVGKLPWGVLILFGGGLSLASAVANSGLAQWLGESLSPFASLGVIVMIIAATGFVIFLTELTSNLATTATFLPVIGAIAIQSGIPPLVLCVPVTLAASCAFMLPVATPPNAIVYASGMLTIPNMVKAGILLNLLGMFVLTMVAMWLAPLVFG
jgi:sodium-dependent dicarboxylate transporter 2/3/5